MDRLVKKSTISYSTKYDKDTDFRESSISKSTPFSGAVDDHLTYSKAYNEGAYLLIPNGTPNWVGAKATAF